MISGVKEYRELYQQYAQAFRKMSELEHQVRAFNARLLYEADVPVGQSIDYWGDGEAKAPKQCAEAPNP